MPFPQHRRDTTVIQAVVVENIRPERPGEESLAVQRGLDEFIWSIMRQCWSRDRKQRPRISATIQELRQHRLSTISLYHSELSFVSLNSLTNDEQSLFPSSYGESLTAMNSRIDSSFCSIEGTTSAPLSLANGEVDSVGSASSLDVKALFRGYSSISSPLSDMRTSAPISGLQPQIAFPDSYVGHL